MHGLFSFIFHKVFNIWNVAAICFPGQPNSETEHKRKLVGKYLWKRKKLNLYRSAVQAVEIVLLSHVFLSLPLTSLILSIAFLSQRLPGLTSFTSVHQEKPVDLQFMPLLSVRKCGSGAKIRVLIEFLISTRCKTVTAVQFFNGTSNGTAQGIHLQATWQGRKSWHPAAL